MALARRVLEVTGVGGGGAVSLPWLPLSTIYARVAGGFTKAAGNPVLPRGTAGQWDDAEVRELRPVINERGLTVVESDGIWAYYGGNHDLVTPAGGIGLAKSTDNGITWTRYGSNPVITAGGTGWRQTFAYQPSVVKRSTGTRVMLAAGRDAGGSDSIGVLTSTNGLSWADGGQKLTLGQFADGATAMVEMGVPSMIRLSSGTWTALLEARKSGVTNGWRIFGATASDPTGTWTPMNSGQPIFAQTGAGWEATGVANPQLIECTPGQFVMLYNGIGGGTLWQVGLADTTDFVTWNRYGGNPVLSKGAGAAWDNLETETSFLWKEPLASTLRILYQGYRSSDTTAAVGLATAT